MEFIALYCVLPMVIAGTCIIYAIRNAYLTACETQRKIELHKAKLQEAQAKAELHRSTIEMRAAKATNDVILQDTKIEIEKLKLLKLQKDLGLTAPEFSPKDYE